MRLRLTESLFIPLGLVVILGVMLYLTTDLGPVARSVPLAVLVPTLAFAAMQVLLEIFPGLTKQFYRLQHRDMFDIEGWRRKTEAESSEAANRRRREVVLFAWLALMMTLLFLFGLLIGAPLFLFLFLSQRSGESLRLSAVIALAGLALLYGIFVYILRASLYEGQLWMWLQS